MSEETKVEIPAQFKALIEGIEKMSVIELNELVKTLEKRFGVSAVAAAAGPAAGPVAEAEEKSTSTLNSKMLVQQKSLLSRLSRKPLPLVSRKQKTLLTQLQRCLKKTLRKKMLRKSRRTSKQQVVKWNLNSTR